MKQARSRVGSGLEGGGTCMHHVDCQDISCHCSLCSECVFVDGSNILVLIAFTAQTQALFGQKKQVKQVVGGDNYLAKKIQIIITSAVVIISTSLRECLF